MMKNFCPGAGRQRALTPSTGRPQASTQGTSRPRASTMVQGYQVLMPLPLPYGGNEYGLANGERIDFSIIVNSAPARQAMA